MLLRSEEAIEQALVIQEVRNNVYHCIVLIHDIGNNLEYIDPRLIQCHSLQNFVQRMSTITLFYATSRRIPRVIENTVNF